MAHRVTEDDTGKRVVTADGDSVGRVSDVRDDVAYVDPDPGIAETIATKLGWSEADSDDYPLDDAKVDAVTENEVRLRGEL